MRRIAPAIAASLLLALASCKKENSSPSGNQFTSLLFDASSPAAREALATPVSFRLTDANYDQWERAQRFLDAVPRSALVSAAGSQGNAVDRAVQTLEASPRARTAIERTGLTVRDFVLETIALAQAAEVRAGKPPGGVNVPPENVQFVQRYESRILLARGESRVQGDPADNRDEADTTVIGVQSTTDVAPQPEREANAPPTDSAVTGERTRTSNSIGLESTPSEQPRPPVDTARDTVPR